MKTIGLIGGMSWESTVTYYQTINRAVAEALFGVPDHIAARARDHLTDDLLEVLDRFEARRTPD